MSIGARSRARRHAAPPGTATPSARVIGCDKPAGDKTTGAAPARKEVIAVVVETDRRWTKNDRRRHSPVAWRSACQAPTKRVIDCDKPKGAKRTGTAQAQEKV